MCQAAYEAIKQLRTTGASINTASKAQTLRGKANQRGRHNETSNAFRLPSDMLNASGRTPRTSSRVEDYPFAEAAGRFDAHQYLDYLLYRGVVLFALIRRLLHEDHMDGMSAHNPTATGCAIKIAAARNGARPL